MVDLRWVHCDELYCTSAYRVDHQGRPKTDIYSAGWTVDSGSPIRIYCAIHSRVPGAAGPSVDKTVQVGASPAPGIPSPPSHREETRRTEMTGEQQPPPTTPRGFAAMSQGGGSFLRPADIGPRGAEYPILSVGWSEKFLRPELHLGTGDGDEVILGVNMTTAQFLIERAPGLAEGPGDMTDKGATPAYLERCSKLLSGKKVFLMSAMVNTQQGPKASIQIKELL